MCWDLGSCTIPCLSIPGQHFPPYLSSAWASDSISAFSLAAWTTGSGRAPCGSQENTGDWASSQGMWCWFWLNGQPMKPHMGSRQSALELGAQSTKTRGSSLSVREKAALLGRKKKPEFASKPRACVHSGVSDVSVGVGHPASLKLLPGEGPQVCGP